MPCLAAPGLLPARCQRYATGMPRCYKQPKCLQRATNVLRKDRWPLVESCLFSDNCLLHTLTVLTGTPGRAGSRWPQFWEPVCEERPRFPGTLLPARRAQASPGALPATHQARSLPGQRRNYRLALCLPAEAQESMPGAGQCWARGTGECTHLQPPGEGQSEMTHVPPVVMKKKALFFIGSDTGTANPWQVWGRQWGAVRSWA